MIEFFVYVISGFFMLVFFIAGAMLSDHQRILEAMKGKDEEFRGSTETDSE